MSDTLSDPFSAAAAGIGQPQLPSQQPGMLGVSPSTWESIAQLGAGAIQGANQRTGDGHLANGTGIAGGIMGAVQGYYGDVQNQAKLRSALAQQGAQTTGLNIGNQAAASSLGLTKARNALSQRILSDPNFMQQLQSSMGGGSSPPPGGVLGASGVANGPLQPAGGGSGPMAAVEPAVHRLESGSSMAPGIMGDGGKAAGPMQVHQAALDDVNRANGTQYTLPMLVQNPQLGKWVGDQYLQQQVGRFGPRAGMAAYNAGPGSVQNAIRSGSPVQGLSPSYQQALGSSGQLGPVDPQGALAQSQRLMAQANQLEVYKSLGLPIPGDPSALREQAKTYLDLATSGPKAGAVASADAAVKLATGGQVASNEANAKNASDLAYAGPTAKAKAIGAMVKPFTDRFGNIYQGDDNGNVRYLGRGSEVKDVLQPDGSYNYGDVGGLGVGKVSNLAGNQGGAGGGTENGGIPSKPSNMQTEFLHERGEGLAKQFNEVDETASAAKDSNYLFDNMRQDAKNWDMGKFASFEGDARAWLSAVGHTFGYTPENSEAMKTLDEKLADYQAFNKSSGQLLRSAVHDTSSRAAVQEYKLIGDSLPQPTSSAQAFGQVADQWQGMNDFRLAKQKFFQGYQNNPQEANIDFNSRVSPTSFMLNRMSQSPEGQDTLHRMLVSMQGNPQGRLAAGRMLLGYNYAKSHGLFDDLPAEGGAPGQ